METIVSFSFEARRLDGPWIISAGRWDSHEQAARAAAHWLVARASETNQQFELRVVQVEEWELDNNA